MYRTAILAILIILSASAFSCASSEDPNISISLSCFKEQVGISEPNQLLPTLIPVTEANSLDPIVLKLTITNKSTKDISVLYPEFPGRTVLPVFRDKSDGKLIPPQVKWSTSLSTDYINIPQSKNYEVLLHLEEPYPLGIPSGSYEMSLQYTPDYKTWFQTNTVSFTISPQSEEEKKQLEDYIKVMQTGGYEYTLKYGEQFLSNHPTSRFRSDVYLEMALEYTNTLKKFETARNMLDMAISDKSSTTYSKGKALYQKAHLLKDKMGEIDEAIECLEKSQLRSAKIEAEQWKQQKELKLQNQTTAEPNLPNEANAPSEPNIPNNADNQGRGNPDSP